MRSRIVSVFSDALATAKVPVLDVATRYQELGEALLPLINPHRQREVRHRDHQLHPRERVGAAGGRSGDRQALEHERDRQPERLREVPDGAGHGQGRQRAAAPPTEMAVGFGHGAADDASSRAASCPARGHRRRPAAAAPPPAPPRRLPELLTPGRVGQGRSASPKPTSSRRIESGDLKAKKIGSAYRDHRGPRSTSSSKQLAAQHRRERELAADPADPADVRGRGPRQARLPRMRRRGALERRASRRWSARTAAPSRRRSSPPTAAIVKEHDLARRCAPSRRQARLGGGPRLGAVPELQGDLAVRPTASRSAASSAARRRSSRTSDGASADHARERAAVQRRRDAGARAICGGGTAAAGSRRTG